MQDMIPLIPPWSARSRKHCTKLNKNSTFSFVCLLPCTWNEAKTEPTIYSTAPSLLQTLYKLPIVTRLWFHYIQILCNFQKPIIHTKTEKQNLPNNLILSMMKDKKGRIPHYWEKNSNKWLETDIRLATFFHCLTYSLLVFAQQSAQVWPHQTPWSVDWIHSTADCHLEWMQDCRQMWPHPKRQWIVGLFTDFISQPILLNLQIPNSMIFMFNYKRDMQLQELPYWYYLQIKLFSRPLTVF